MGKKGRKRKKSNTRKTNNEKKSDNVIIIDVNSINLNSRKFTTSEIGRGTGTIKPKKGKGSFRRKKKYKPSNEKK